MPRRVPESDRWLRLGFLPWDRETYDKAVAEEVERQKEMPRGR